MLGYFKLHDFMMILLILIFIILNFKGATSGAEYTEFLNDCDKFYTGRVSTYLSHVVTDTGLVQIDTNLLCKFSIKDYRDIKSEYNHFIYDIINISRFKSDSLSSLISNPHYKYLDSKTNFGKLDIVEKDKIRSDVLTSLGSIFNLKEGNYEDYHSLIVRNTVDYFSGFIIQNYTYYHDILPSVQKHASKNLELYYKMFNLEFKGFKDRDYRVAPKVENPSIRPTSYDSDYLNYKVVELRTSFLNLECGSSNDYISLIANVSSYLLFLQMHYDIFDWPRYSNLKYDVMYAPDIRYNTEISNWIALGLNDLTLRLSEININFELYYYNIGKPNLERIVLEISKMEDLVNDIFSQYSKFQNSYYIYLRHVRLSTRYHRDPNLYNSVLTSSNIC